MIPYYHSNICPNETDSKPYFQRKTKGDPLISSSHLIMGSLSSSFDPTLIPQRKAWVILENKYLIILNTFYHDIFNTTLVLDDWIKRAEASGIRMLMKYATSFAVFFIWNPRLLQLQHLFCNFGRNKQHNQNDEAHGLWISLSRSL